MIDWLIDWLIDRFIYLLFFFGQQQVRELETELEAEQHRHVDTQKGLRKQDRRLQEVILQLDEGQKGQDRMKDMIEKLQQKNKQYKRQVEEAVSWRSHCLSFTAHFLSSC